jgi:hypothetical protein
MKTAKENTTEEMMEKSGKTDLANQVHDSEELVNLFEETKFTAINSNAAKRIMRYSVKNINDLIKFWYLNDIFREVLSMNWSKSIWLEVIRVKVYSHDFLPLGEILVYLYENGDISLNVIKRYILQIDQYKIGVPKILLTKINFNRDTIIELFIQSLKEGNYIIASFMLRSGIIPDYDPKDIIYTATIGNNPLPFGGRGVIIRSTSIDKVCQNIARANFLEIIIRYDRNFIMLNAVIKKGYRPQTLDFKKILEMFPPGERLVSIFKILSDNQTNFKELNLLPLVISSSDTIFGQIFSLVRNTINLTRNFEIVPERGRDRSTLLEYICVHGQVGKLKILIENNINISDPTLSTIDLVEAIKNSEYESTYEIISIMENARYK